MEAYRPVFPFQSPYAQSPRPSVQWTVRPPGPTVPQAPPQGPSGVPSQPWLTPQAPLAASPAANPPIDFVAEFQRFGIDPRPMQSAQREQALYGQLGGIKYEEPKKERITDTEKGIATGLFGLLAALGTQNADEQAQQYFGARERGIESRYQEAQAKAQRDYAQQVQGLQAQIGGEGAFQRGLAVEQGQRLQGLTGAFGATTEGKRFGLAERQFDLAVDAQAFNHQIARSYLAMAQNPQIVADAQIASLVERGIPHDRAEKMILGPLITAAYEADFAEQSAPWRIKALEQQFGINEKQATLLDQQIEKNKIDLSYLGEEWSAKLAFLKAQTDAIGKGLLNDQQRNVLGSLQSMLGAFPFMLQGSMVYDPQTKTYSMPPEQQKVIMGLFNNAIARLETLYEQMGGLPVDPTDGQYQTQGGSNKRIPYGPPPPPGGAQSNKSNPFGFVWQDNAPPSLKGPINNQPGKFDPSHPFKTFK